MDQIPKIHEKQKRIKWDPTNKYQSISPPRKSERSLVPFETKCVCFFNFFGFVLFFGCVSCCWCARSAPRWREGEYRRFGGLRARLSLSLCVCMSLSLCVFSHFEHLIVTTRNLRYSCDRCIFLYRVDSEKGLGCFVESIWGELVFAESGGEDCCFSSGRGVSF
jgi:hypothetical protein